MKPLGPRTQYDLTIAILVLQGMNAFATFWAGWLGPVAAACITAFLIIAQSVLTFMVTGIFRPAASLGNAPADPNARPAR